ncbi:MAG: hypothetical protein IJ042_01125 [Butyricicoccus sp.]|nr:hypothetical protein [Butyricicoccus sp.]
MSKQNKTAILRGLAFLLVFLILFAGVNHVMRRKSLVGPWNMTTKVAGFYNEPADEFEVMFFGSSHAYASFQPLTLYEETGVKSYVFATQKQPIWATYHYMVEAFKTQKPALAVVEVNMIPDAEEYLDEGTNHSYLDDLPFSMNKLELIEATAPEGERAPYVLTFLKYHARWSELGPKDFTYRASTQQDDLKGYVLLPDTEAVPVYKDLSEVTVGTIPEKNLGYIEKIRDLCAENGVQLWLVKAPSNPLPDQVAGIWAVEQWAEENGVAFDDFNRSFSEIGLTPEVFYDQAHLDALGAETFTRWFADLLTERYPDLSADLGDTAWLAAMDSMKPE